MNAADINGPKRGVSVYSYSGELGITMTLEDVFMEMKDLGATGIEILANGHVDNYPNPTEEWVDKWFRMCQKYDVTPAEYGHWVDSRLHKGGQLSTKESLVMLERDIRLAHRLGFTVLRTKLGIIDETLMPVSNWREFVKEALPLAEECNVVMCPEIHLPTALKSKVVDDYVEFIEQTGTKSFGLNIDFSTFQTDLRIEVIGYPVPGLPKDGSPASYPEEMIPLLPYIHACHAKFVHMNEDFTETAIPYEEIIKVLRDHNWNGTMLSEYEGPHKDESGFVSEQIRRQHVMMKRILGY